MKIALMEWVCGGGIDPSQPIEGSLFDEGWGMLHCLASQLITSDHQLKIPLDVRLKSNSLTVSGDGIFGQGLTHEPEIVWIDSAASCTPSSKQKSVTAREQSLAISEAWRLVVADCDAALVIAPEIDGVLQKCIEHLSDSGVQLLNCRDPSLTCAADKLMTADVLRDFAVEHPPGLPVHELSDSWLQATQRQQGNQQWVIKPRRGAGCDDLWVVHEPRSWLETVSGNDELMIQPWVEGGSYSRSAIVDAEGNWHWLPLMTQNFRDQRVSRDSDSYSTASYGSGRGQCVMRRSYSGGELTGHQMLDERTVQLFEKLEACFATSALGWIGIDLVFDHQRGHWTVIEINPRCTTSLIALSKSFRGNLAENLMSLALGHADRIQGSW